MMSGEKKRIHDEIIWRGCKVLVSGLTMIIVDAFPKIDGKGVFRNIGGR